MLKTILQAKFPEFTEPGLINDIIESGSYKEIPAGSTLMEVGDPLRTVPLIITGSIKILGQDEDGREILLYHLYPGQTCAISLSCCLGNRKSEIHALAEDELEIIEIPIYKVDEWLGKYRSWLSFVMNTYHLRFDEMLQTINHIAFKKMDQRLIYYLKSKAHAVDSDKIQATHREIAHELGTSREVVSRLLKQLERLGYIKLHRNEIELVELPDLD